MKLKPSELYYFMGVDDGRPWLFIGTLDAESEYSDDIRLEILESAPGYLDQETMENTWEIYGHSEEEIRTDLNALGYTEKPRE